MPAAAADVERALQCKDRLLYAYQIKKPAVSAGFFMDFSL